MFKQFIQRPVDGMLCHHGINWRRQRGLAVPAFRYLHEAVFVERPYGLIYMRVAAHIVQMAE
jgi:hypothetical protein